MRIEDLFYLYKKERDYQKLVFGGYENNPAFNLATFLILLDSYLNKIKQAYVGKWSNDLPTWLANSNELELVNGCPIEAYENLVKLFALSGAAIETYCNIDPDEWRKEGVNPKWKGGFNGK